MWYESDLKVQMAKAMMENLQKTSGKALRKDLKEWKRELQWNTKTQFYGLLSKGGA
jgi:hypothetical protein